MTKKLLSMLLVLAMILCIVPVCAEGETDINVFLSLSRYGDIVQGKSGESMAYVTVCLSGKESYNLNDVFLAAHNAYYEDGEAGYASSESEWGFGIDMLWGDTSGNFGYQVNSGTETVMGLGHEVSDGDYVDAVIYKNAYPDTEGYSMFNMTQTEVYTDSEFEIVLKYFSGYDENWNTIISPCEGATITINGVETEFVTDENGIAIIKLEQEGNNIISAKKSKVLNNEEVPAITAPVCIVNAKNAATEIVHNIAKYYTQIDYSQEDVNLAWIVADMMMYEELFPDSENVLSESQRQAALKVLANFASEAEKPGDLAKCILALRSLGYDARTIVAEDFKTAKPVEKLISLVDLKDESVKNIYTLPYVLIALSQDDDYATQEQLDWLISTALESKESWQDTEYGTDALTPMILALAPYVDSNEAVKAEIDKTVEILKSEQRKDGLIDGFEGYESASTGLAICALSAAEIDAATVKKGDNSLIEGLLTTANEDFNGFSNAFATEQGFRGLIAWQLLVDNKEKTMYDFKSYPKNEANIFDIEYCPVIFDVSPEGAVIIIEGKTPVSGNCFDLDTGKYEYTATASGYYARAGEIEITDDEAKQHIAKTIKISLDKITTGGGGGGGGSTTTKSKEEGKTDQEQVQSPQEQIQPPLQTEENVLSENTFADVKAADWYYSSVKYVYENGLFNGTGDQFEPNEAMSRAMLVTCLHRLDASPKVSVACGFNDVPQNVWYSEGINWAAENKIITGVSDSTFAPDLSLTREQLAVIIYRYAVYRGDEITTNDINYISSYKDKEKVSSYAVDAVNYVIAAGIMNGRQENIIAANEHITRAEAATMLMRFAELKG